MSEKFRIMVRCPTTGEDVYTGLTLDRASYAKLNVGTARLRCSACGEIHIWNKDDSFAEETPDA